MIIRLPLEDLYSGGIGGMGKRLSVRKGKERSVVLRSS